MSWGYGWRPYVSVGQKLRRAEKAAEAAAKKEKRSAEPVVIEGRTIARTFWGKAWCDNLHAYEDYSNRLPRGATYVRNGSVVDMVVSTAQVKALVAGSEPYNVRITISKLPEAKWKSIRRDCSSQIDSLLDLLSGKLSDGVMRRLTDQKKGLFPAPDEIQMSCSCPDWSSCCKHIAAVMYGVGSRLDTRPELLFLLRGVDHQELITQAIAEGNLGRELDSTAAGQIAADDLSGIFGIELDQLEPPVEPPKPRSRKPSRSAAARQAAAAKQETSSGSSPLPVPKSRKRVRATLSEPVRKAIRKLTAAAEASSEKVQHTRLDPPTDALPQPTSFEVGMQMLDELIAIGTAARDQPAASPRKRQPTRKK